MLKCLHGVHRSPGDHGGLFEGKIGNETQVQHLSLLIGQCSQDRSGLTIERFERVRLDVPAGSIVCAREALRFYSPVPLSMLVDDLVPGDSEHERNKSVLISAESFDLTKRSEEHLVGDAISIIASLRVREGDHLARKSVPQPLEPWSLPETRRGERPRERGIRGSVVLHGSLIDALATRLETPC